MFVEETSARIFFKRKLAPQFVQTGLHAVLMGVFCVSAKHFHTVFNKTVEKFHELFIIQVAFCRAVADELLRRLTFPTAPQ
jgi:hypothetical protein